MHNPATVMSPAAGPSHFWKQSSKAEAKHECPDTEVSSATFLACYHNASEFATDPTWSARAIALRT